MSKGKTSSGFEFEISEEINNDYELVEQLADLDENPLLLTKIVDKVLGKEQAKNLKNHIRNENGVVPTDKMTQEIVEIFQGGSIKNS